MDFFLSLYREAQRQPIRPYKRRQSHFSDSQSSTLQQPSTLTNTVTPDTNRLLVFMRIIREKYGQFTRATQCILACQRELLTNHRPPEPYVTMLSYREKTLFCTQPNERREREREKLPQNTKRRACTTSKRNIAHTSLLDGTDDLYGLHTQFIITIGIHGNQIPPPPPRQKDL